MTPKTRRAYKLAKVDDIFDAEMTAAANGTNKNRRPPFYAGEIEKHIYVSVYYGWYIGKYGVEKGKEIFPE